MVERIVLYTTYVSILAQLATGGFGVWALAHNVGAENEALKVALNIEMFVQAIELIFYIWFVSKFNLATMAPTRYLDWVVTTPLMLISTMLFYYYEQTRQEGRDTTRSVRDFLETHRSTIAIVVVANFLMIAFGYAGEVGWLSMGWSVVLGFAAFGAAFSTMWSRLASKSDTGRQLFSFIATVWTLYGVAFLFPVGPKNIAYNGLDVVAKNVFGVFLSLKVLEASSSSW